MMLRGVVRAGRSSNRAFRALSSAPESSPENPEIKDDEVVKISREERIAVIESTPDAFKGVFADKIGGPDPVGVAKAEDERRVEKSDPKKVHAYHVAHAEYARKMKEFARDARAENEAKGFDGRRRRQKAQGPSALRRIKILSKVDTIENTAMRMKAHKAKMNEFRLHAPPTPPEIHELPTEELGRRLALAEARQKARAVERARIQSTATILAEQKRVDEEMRVENLARSARRWTSARLSLFDDSNVSESVKDEEEEMLIAECDHLARKALMNVVPVTHAFNDVLPRRLAAVADAFQDDPSDVFFRGELKDVVEPERKWLHVLFQQAANGTGRRRASRRQRGRRRVSSFWRQSSSRQDGRGWPQVRPVPG